MKKTTKVEIDAITKAVIHGAFVNIVDEMGEILQKTATSFILCEVRDFSATILDAKGRLIAQAEKGLPLHVASAELQLKTALDTSGGDLEQGDIILQNDPYTAGGNHLPDWTFIKPVFVEGELTFFILCKGHQMDTGGNYPSGYVPDPYDIHSEGLLIPPTKIFKAGERQAIYDFILHNVRWPENVRLDNIAIMATLKRAEERATDLCKKYGKATILDVIDTIIEDSEKAIRAEISQWPDGTYEGDSLIDRDGSGHENIHVRVALTVKGDEITIDFSKSDKQVNFVNSSLGCTYSCTYMGILPCFDPNILLNHGMFGPIKIIAPEGTLVNPKYPAALGCCGGFPGCTIIEAIQMAAGKVVPEGARVRAAWGTSITPTLIGTDPRTGERYWLVGFNGDGGEGARDGADGCPHIALVVGGGSMNKMPIELMESICPWLRNIEYAMLTDSAGAGKYRGGLGMHWAVLNEGPDLMITTAPCNGEKQAPFGQKGGKPGILSKIYRIRHGKESAIPTMSLAPLKTGDILGMCSSGGGGVGNPFERPIDKVKEDVINGYVSMRSAQEDYGVVINPETFEVDLETTNKLRGSQEN